MVGQQEPAPRTLLPLMAPREKQATRRPPPASLSFHQQFLPLISQLLVDFVLQVPTPQGWLALGSHASSFLFFILSLLWNPGCGPGMAASLLFILFMWGPG